MTTRLEPAPVPRELLDKVSSLQPPPGPPAHLAGKVHDAPLKHYYPDPLPLPEPESTQRPQDAVLVDGLYHPSHAYSPSRIRAYTGLRRESSGLAVETRGDEAKRVELL